MCERVQTKLSQETTSSQDTGLVTESFNIFTKELDFQQIVGYFTRAGQSLPEGQFVISHSLLGQQSTALGTPVRIDDVNYHLDGEYGFCLGYEETGSSPVWFAIASFSLSHNYSPDAPLIVQLQGSKARQKTLERERKAARMQNLFSFESAQIAIIDLWSRSVGYKALYMSPLSLNPYYGIDPERDVRLRRRYIDTALNYGFRPDEHSVLKLELL